MMYIPITVFFYQFQDLAKTSFLRTLTEHTYLRSKMYPWKWEIQFKTRLSPQAGPETL